MVTQRCEESLWWCFRVPSKVPISTWIILRNTIKRSRLFNQLLLTQDVQISIVFLSFSQINYHENKIMASCVFNLKYLSQNLVKLYVYGVFWKHQICPWFQKLNKICRSNRVKQNIKLFVPVLYNPLSYHLFKRYANFLK